MKILPWLIIALLLYIVYYFISRYENKLKELNKIIGENSKKISELNEQIEVNRLLIEKNKLDIQDNKSNINLKSQHSIDDLD